MKRSVLLRTFGGFFILTTLLSGLIIAVSFYIVRNGYMEAKTKDLVDLARSLKGEITPLVVSRDPSKLETHTRQLGKEIHTRITIVEPAGSVLADSEENPVRMENHRMRTEIAQALDGNVGTFVRFSETLKQNMLYVAIPVMKGDKPLYVLRVSRFMKEIAVTTNHLIEKILIITLVVDILALLFAFFFSRSISKPVKELSGALRKAVNEQFNIRVFMKRNDEFKELADSFNYMTSRIAELFAELSSQKEELDSIMASLQEGLLVLDREDRVLFTNASLRGITGVDLEPGKRYWEVVREPGLSDLVKQVRNSKTNTSTEVQTDTGVFLCSATFLPLKEEITVLFHDITEIRQLERIKTDFVVNVSHELRTPLTSIKGFLETIETGSLTEENRHYVDVIRRNTDRLINIVSDLLTLSELEEKTNQLKLEPVDLKSLIEGVLKIFDPQIKEKGLDVAVTVDPGTPPVQGDPYKLEQVFTNLLDNAVKYMEKGGLAVTVTGDEKQATVLIEDTGPGISREHLLRIFERFYVVDKSRSKKLGGTGLGLSIVKRIILLHHGTITIESTPGKGTRCIVTLPLGN